MRQIVLDTESTGFEPSQGHRLVEIGCIEVFNYLPTGRIFHQYINPERDIPLGAFEVHGLSREFLSDYPVFKDIAHSFIDFIEDSELIIHNAKFDMKFLNFELVRYGHKEIDYSRAIDTLQMARKKFPGSPVSLDALCKKFGVNNANRKLHGALLDAELLAEVYLELMGGRQPDLKIASIKEQDGDAINEIITSEKVLPARNFAPSEQEITDHTKYVEKIANPIWRETKNS